MLFHQANTAAASQCANTASDTWAPTRSGTVNATLSGTARALEIWYTATGTAAASTPTGTVGAVNDVVTCTINGANTYQTIDVYEFNKSSGTWGFVADSSNTAASGATTFTSGSLTLSNPSVIVGQLMLDNSQTITAGTGYTAVNSDGGAFSWSEYHIVSSSEAAQATGPTQTGYVFMAAAFQASTGAAAPRRLMLLGVGGSQ